MNDAAIQSPSEETPLSQEQYRQMYQQSIENPKGFWQEMAQQVSWFKTPTTIKNTSFTGDISIKWYEDGILNACYNCLDRHLATKADEVAFIFEGNDPKDSYHVTYGEAVKKVSQLANALKEQGVKKGDRVTIYMPMIVEACYAMLACARIGAVHSVVFGGFSSEALANRITDCDSNIVITANEGVRGKKTIPLKASVDKALEHCPDVKSVIVFKRTDSQTAMQQGRDVWWHNAVDSQSTDCPCEEMNAEDPLFILYTSGSTGKPKGVLHTTGGYLVYAATTHRYSFDYREGETYWCTADVGWITGHSYIVYGPLANGAKTVVFEGVPNYPDASRFWQVVEKHKVNIFYTAPTAIRSLISAGDDYVTKTDRSSLRILGTVGEPINKEAWLWYRDVVGEKHCPIIDTYWQTETGGHIITPLASFELKAGSATLPFFGIKPVLVDSEGVPKEGATDGNLCIADSWPGQMRTVYGDHQRFKETYFSMYPSYYFTGDGARRDEDGYYWITGRVDDVINISGHRLGTAEIENAIGKHEAVAESAVVDYAHHVKGQGIYAFVILKKGVDADDELKKQITLTVRQAIGAIASPDVIQFSPDLPKTRSGKIMRRILRKIAANETGNLGDTSTLADPAIVEQLIHDRVNV